MAVRRARLSAAVSGNIWKEHTPRAFASTDERIYQEDVDWVFHVARRSLMPEAVEQRVKELRRAGVSFRDTVPTTTRRWSHRATSN